MSSPNLASWIYFIASSCWTYPSDDSITCSYLCDFSLLADSNDSSNLLRSWDLMSRAIACIQILIALISLITSIIMIEPTWKYSKSICNTKSDSWSGKCTRTKEEKDDDKRERERERESP